MGAEFVTVDMATEVSADGYAKEMTAEQEQATAAMYDEGGPCGRHRHHHRADPRTARPRLLTEETVAGNGRAASSSTWPPPTAATCPVTVADQEVVTEAGVTHPGYTDLAAAAGPDLAALRHQHRQPADPDDPGEGRRADPRPRRRRGARHHGRP